ncbi:hypothetical protein Tco_0975244 [Tanacetum coccineum]|uniref:Reverse transcriptase Ty1/copia-type domain-containing protein n=1 Tax=Tanacetum coccineum TaxID=301880 RepID=A0ABQ5EE36_9ASTR
MLMKPQVFYDNIYKQALGYQNPFYLKKAQRIRPTLYDGILIFKKHDVLSMSLKGKNVVEKDVRLNNPNVNAPGMFKLNLAPLAPKLLDNRDAHIDYIKNSREHADILCEIVKHARALRPLDSDLDSAWYCQIKKRLDCKDYGLWRLSDGKVTISRVYYVEGLGHNLFSVGQFCDSDLKILESSSAMLLNNQRTRLIIETIHVTFDELIAMDLEQFSSGPGPQLLTLGTLSSGLVPSPPSSTPYFIAAAARRPADPTDSPVSTSIDQDAPSSNSTSQGSSTNVQPSHTPLELLGKWTKNNPLANVIGDPSRSVSKRKQLKTAVMWCYFDVFLTSVEPKNFKEAMLESSWIEAINPVDTLMVEKSKMDEELQGKPVDPTHYHGMIGSLMYLTSNKPDLVSVVRMCARPRGCQDTRRSISGSAQFLGDKLVSWSSKKQKSTAISSTKAEYIALARIMNHLIVQQHALDDALAAPDNRAIIRKCNMRIEPTKTQKEVTYQVALDALKLTACYKAFLVTVDAPEIYMHHFWFTITHIKDSLSYKFKLDNKSFKVGEEVFRDVLQICPRIRNQEFVEPPTHEETVAFIKELGYRGELESITEMHIDHMSQPWRTFASINNRCLFGKVTTFDQLQLSRA